MNTRFVGKGLISLGILLLVSCGTYFNQPLGPEAARIGEKSDNTTDVLREFPLPDKPVVVGVYNFKDQTGQYKNVQAGSTFSTAIPQGATTMLIKALEDSKWFTPIERENLGNLLNERNIIRSTRDEYRRQDQPNQPQLPPLLFAGILLEGGVVSYDSNIITGGAGARYFGLGASTQYRQDRLSIYLRAVSTSNGKILKTVYVSKTILSQALDASLFKYVSFKRLLEVETGFTKNEPIQLAMKEAIEKAVEGLIIEGIEEGLWKTKDGARLDERLVKDYKAEKQEEEIKGLYNRPKHAIANKGVLEMDINGPVLNGDFSKKDIGVGGRLGYTRNLTDYLLVNFNTGYSYMVGGKSFYEEYMNADLNLVLHILPYDGITPYFYGGGGYFTALHEPPEELDISKSTFKFQIGVGLKFRINNSMGLRLYAEDNFTNSDALEHIVQGKRKDFYYNFGLGLNFKLGR
ncbi:CsgG/HfaB family protein [Sediminicola luteus]|uniref:Outer membrane protein beta-barrel domain-containing protein n=1 Tax=Sediminicola luteus TaxID=319238 RepID=A0A2A4G8P2_9FLAO|nr:CsgG/HfaB family protein [Sediminicola luteus]PCE64340.1 hypothetical protein B7P33_08565 [Sediminicola luteus]